MWTDTVITTHVPKALDTGLTFHRFLCLPLPSCGVTKFYQLNTSQLSYPASGDSGTRPGSFTYQVPNSARYECMCRVQTLLEPHPRSPRPQEVGTERQLVPEEALGSQL